MTARPGEERGREELRERAQKPGWDCSERLDHEIEERPVETERRKVQLPEAWRRRHTLPAREEDRPGDGRRRRQ